MGLVGQMESGILAGSVYSTNQSRKTEGSGSYGKTIGEPKLSEEGKKYYEELKKKYSDMDFVLVSQDKSEQAETLAAKYTSKDKILVVIDEESIEQMATDEAYRTKYEGIIGNADTKLEEMRKSLDENGLKGNVKTFGIKVSGDGTTSYFAVLDDANKKQQQRIEERAQEKKAEKKEAEKKAEKKAAEKKGDAAEAKKAEKLTMVSADSIEELLKKIDDALLSQRSDSVRTQQELMVGQNFDFRG